MASTRANVGTIRNKPTTTNSRPNAIDAAATIATNMASDHHAPTKRNPRAIHGAASISGRYHHCRAVRTDVTATGRPGDGVVFTAPVSLTGSLTESLAQTHRIAHEALRRVAATD